MSRIKRLWGEPGIPAELKDGIDFSCEHMERSCSLLLSTRDGTCFYSLVYNKFPEMVGEVGFYGYNKEDSSAKLFVRIVKEHRGKGYSWGALELILHYFFFRWGGHTMYCELSPHNILAQKILLKFGFEPVYGETEKFIVKITLNQFIALFG
jgi:RimJ/RimL family protein N-acetyltransferase